jgi:hypothetical protein
VDTTLIRLLDGSKACLHAIIDNFSRRVMAWRVNDTFIPAVTAELLVEAGREIEDTKPQLLVDGGVENYNSAVDKLVAFYVDQHNTHLLHSAFKGQTPDEMYFGTGDDIPKTLEEAKLEARELRLKSNRERNCQSVLCQRTPVAEQISTCK